MNEELNKEVILKHLESWNCFDKNISEESAAYKVTLISGNKSIIITTPYEVGEFFLDFTIDDKPYYSDWYEIMSDPLSDFMSYTKQVAKNFLFNEVRVQSRGLWLFRTHELQYRSDGIWCNVFC